MVRIELHVTLKHMARPRTPGLTPRAILEKLSTMQMVDVHVPIGRHLVLPRRTEPTPHQQLLRVKVGRLANSPRVLVV